MEKIEIKIEGYEVEQAICNDEGELSYKPLTWVGKKVIMVLVEPSNIGD